MNNLAGLAHDMRAPLAAMDALCMLLDAHAEDPQAVRRDAARMQAACAQLMQLADALLGQETALCPASCTPEKMVSVAVLPYEQRVSVTMTGDCGAKIIADACAVRRILTNLLSNAAKYSRGQILLRVHAEREEERIVLRVEVEDSGIGMSEETLASLFMPGARGKEAAGFPGCGIGLSAANELARQMGGVITARSRLGEGSVMTFTAPFPLEGRAEGALAGLRFLVVEDNALARDALCELLAAHGAKAESTQDGETAVAVFSRSPHGHFDAVLMDVVLPGMDGFAAAQAIRALGRQDAETVRMVALTGAASCEAARMAEQLGMRHALKPVSIPVLKTMFRG